MTTAVVFAAMAVAAPAAAQAPTRVATTAEALVASAGFFHGRPVVVQRRLVTDRGLTRLANTAKPVFVFWRERPSGEEGEVRGDFLDLGRVEGSDPRFSGYDFTTLLETESRGRWPGRDQIFVLLAASLRTTDASKSPTVKAIALSPDAYVDKEVRVIGRFKGRNLYGELPAALGRGKWDFVIQSAEGSLWVTGVRPRGKGFDFDPSKRVDTGQWVEVHGTVRREGLMPFIEAAGIALAAAPEQQPVEVEGPPPPVQPPPDVVFSAPVTDDLDVDRSAPVRVQFSRDMDPRTIAGRVRVSYVGTPGGTSALAEPPPHTVTYNDAAHAIEVRFAQPLERFQRVRVELLEGMTALDGQPLKPWAVSFTTGR